MAKLRKITPCLWYDDQAEAAASFYVGIFPHSKITAISHYGEAGSEIHGRKAGSVLTVNFELDEQPFTALNGGPIFRLNEAVSFQVFCETQQELDRFWDKLSAGGDPAAQQCGWLKDKFGLSWQIVPTIMEEVLAGGVTEKSQRAFAAMMEMKKLDIAALKKAYDG